MLSPKMKGGNNNNNTTTKLILFSQPTTNGGGGGALLSTSHRLWLLLILSFFTLASLLILFSGTHSPARTSTNFSSPRTLVASLTPASPLSADISEALVHYATFSNSTSRMADADLLAISAAIRRRSPCNLLIFGLGHETLLFHTLNHNGRTVFLDESEYYIQIYERRHPKSNLEAYDVSYTTKLSDLHPLLASTRAQRRTDCRPVQNLLFSDCKLGINDLPNQLYDVSWDVILVDGPRGYYADAPGRMAAIFTAAVLARSGGKGKRVDVFVHDYEREVERMCSEEFLCLENMVFSNGQLSQFIIQNRKGGSDGGSGGEEEFEFCLNRNATAAAAP